MKITLFTTNQARHNYFVNLLSNIATELNVVQEIKTNVTKIVPGHYSASNVMKEYFEKVIYAQKKFTTPIVTKILKAKEFFRAEEYHQNYLNKHNLKSCSL